MRWGWRPDRATLRRSLKPLRSLCAVMGAIALTLTTTGIAQAQSRSHRDVRHDVQWYDVETATHHKVPAYKKADIQRVWVSNGGKYVRTTVKLRSVSMRGIEYRILEVSLRTPPVDGGIPTTYSATWSHGHDGGNYVTVTSNGAQYHCDVLRKTSKRQRTLIFALRRHCLPTTRWIRESIRVTALPDDGPVRLRDDAYSRHWVEPGGKFGPRVHAG